METGGCPEVLGSGGEHIGVARSRILGGWYYWGAQDAGIWEYGVTGLLAIWR